jgi:hypothetical protein
MRFIILFPIFTHTITPTLILLFVITNSYFIITKPWAIFWGFFHLFFYLSLSSSCPLGNKGSSAPLASHVDDSYFK